MFGFVFGAMCLAGLVALLTRGPHAFHHRRRCYHDGEHFGPCGRRHRGFGHHGLHAAFHHLDTTPGQEKAIRAALEELRDGAAELRDKVFASRKDVGAALRDDRLDEGVLEELLARHTTDLAELGARAIAALRKIHEALDPEQRRRLARLVETGPRWGFAWMR